MPVRITTRLLRGAAGFLIGLFVWIGITNPYNRFLAFAAEPIARAFESPSVTDLRPDRKQIVVYRSDVPKGSRRPGIPAYDLTFNFILLTTLFAANHRPASGQNVRRFLGSAVLLAPVHVLAVIVWLQDIYANDPAFRTAGYSEPERAFWSYALYFYRLAGQFAIPLVLWWSLAPPAPKGPLVNEEAPRKRRRKRAR